LILREEPEVSQIPVNTKTTKNQIWIVEPIDIQTFCRDYAGLNTASMAKEKVFRGNLI